MRIVVLTDQADRHYFFANRIIQETEQVVGVITGAKMVVKETTMQARIKRALGRKIFFTSLKNVMLQRVFGQYERILFGEKAAAEEAAFHGQKELFEKEHAHLRLAHVEKTHKSVNDSHYVELVRAAKPDVIVVMGTCLIGKDLMSIAPLMLNIHTGLSPYYRGGYTNMWPIIENEYGYFGVTVHKMSLGIDSGDIVYTERLSVTEDDTYGTINCRAIDTGITLMVKALKHAEAQTLQATPQWTGGRLYYNHDFNDWVARTYVKKHQAFLAEHVRREAAQTLDTVDVVENGKRFSTHTV